MVKVSKKLETKFFDYCTINDIGISFDGGRTDFPDEDINGVSALEAFAMLENFGKKVATREPNLLYKALKGKAAFNLQIESWVSEYCLTTEEFDSIGLPKWCKTVFEKALAKKM